MLKAKDHLPLEADCQHRVSALSQITVYSILQLLTKTIINNLAKESNRAISGLVNLQVVEESGL